MKILFVGEGPHDIGISSSDQFSPRPARGTIPTLARKVCPQISSDSIALRWTEIPRFNTEAKKRGYEGKVAAAVLISKQKLRCDGTVCVVDQDRDTDRLRSLMKGKELAEKVVPKSHSIVCGAAVESIEAWTLGVPQAMASELGIDVATVKKLYPHKDVESLVEGSGKPEHRPKMLLTRIADIKRRKDDTEFRQAVAEKTDIAILEKACPRGFKPFVEALRSAFQE